MHRTRRALGERVATNTSQLTWINGAKRIARTLMMRAARELARVPPSLPSRRDLH
jgi:hypothetical protein